VQLLQLAQRNLLNVGKAFDTAAVEQVFSVHALERSARVKPAWQKFNWLSIASCLFFTHLDQISSR
jgi:hypothetical protein